MVSTVARWLADGVFTELAKHMRRGLDREQVQGLALERWRPGQRYCASALAAAELLGVSETGMRNMVLSGRLSFVEQDGRRFYRRYQLEVIANARESRTLGHRHGA